jgi:hypothetical protein
MILGATSNGISIHSNGTSLTGTVYLDDAFVGATSLTQEINVVGNWVSFTPTGSFTTNTTYKGRYRQVGDSIEVFTELNFTGAPNAAQLSINLPGSFTIDTSKLTSPTTPELGFGDGTANDNTVNAFQLVPKWSTTTALLVRYMNNAPPISNAPAVTQAAPFAIGSGDSYYIHYSVPVTQFSNSSSVYSSTNADTDWASCGHTTSSFTGFGTVSAIETQCKRQGGDLLMKGKFITGIPTGTEARLALPIWNGVQLISANSSIIPSIQIAGRYGATSSIGSSPNGAGNTLIEPSVSYFTFSGETTTGVSLSKLLGTALTSNNNQLSVNLRIPIAGWQQSNLIIGQFSGLESCLTTLDCTDTFSAKISATGVTSEENVDFLSGNCSVATNVYTCTFNASIFTVAPNCVISPLELSAINGTMGMINSQSSSSLVYKTVRHDSAALAAPVNLVCQKQGVDYVGKTAKAVASDQNLRTPGVTNGIVSSVTTSSNCTSSPCTIQTNLGNLASSVTRNFAGSYYVNLNTQYQSNVWSCSCSGVTFGTGVNNCQTYRFDNTKIEINLTGLTGTLRDGAFNLICHGQLP